MVAKVFLLLLVAAAAVSLGRYTNDDCPELCNGRCEKFCTELCGISKVNKLGLNFYKNDSCMDNCDEDCNFDCDVICMGHRQVIYKPPPPPPQAKVIALKKYESDSCLEKCNYNCDESCSTLCSYINFGLNYFCSWRFGKCMLKKNDQCIAECDEKCSEACNNDCID